jgi:prepilin-type processing-associated H-X9-DG protein
MSEVKAFTPYWRDGGRLGASNAATPDTPEALAAHFGAGEFKSDSGHTEWVDARTYQTGFTITFTPNTVVRYESGGLPYDVDFNSMREGRSTTTPTYASVTSRSYHPGGVNTMMMDGSVRFVAKSISLPVWWALGSRAGGEPASPDRTAPPGRGHAASRTTARSSAIAPSKPLICSSEWFAFNWTRSTPA